MVIVLKVKLMTQIQSLDEAVCILLRSYELEKYINLSVHPAVIGKYVI